MTDADALANLVDRALWIARYLRRSPWLLQFIVPSTCREEFFKAVDTVDRCQREMAANTELARIRGIR